MRPNTIAHFRNGIGNFISITPALQALASMDKSGMIDMCVDGEWFDSRKNPLLEILELLPFVNKVYTIKEVIDEPYKVWFWTRWNSHGAAMEVFKRKYFYEETFDIVNTHESDFYMQILRKHYKYTGEKPPMKIIPASEPVLDKSKKNIVLVNGGFGEFCVMKKWAKFNELADEIKGFYGDDVCLIKIGHKSELAEVKSADIDFVDKLSVTQSAKVLQQADLVVSNDTGDMHIADSFGTPLIVLWGGTIINKNRPINSKSKIINLALDCQPCQQNGDYRTCNHTKCLNDITVGEVMFYLRNFLSKGEFE